MKSAPGVLGTLLILIACVPAQEAALPELESLRVSLGAAGSDHVVLEFSRMDGATFEGEHSGWPMRGSYRAPLTAEHWSWLNQVTPLAQVDSIPTPGSALVETAQFRWVRRDGESDHCTFGLDAAPKELMVALLTIEGLGKRLSWVPVSDRSGRRHPVLPEVYRCLFDVNKMPESAIEALPYEHIDLSFRSGSSIDTGGVAYEVRLSRDGGATYTGRGTAQRPGRHRARLNPKAFARLCWFIDKLGLEAKAGTFHGGTLHASITRVSLYPGTGPPVLFDDMGSQAPSKSKASKT